MLAFIEFTYDSRSRFSSESTRELYNEFRERFPTFQLSEWKEEDEKRPYPYISEQVLIELEDDGVWLNQHGFEFTIKRFKGAYFTDSNIHRRTSSLSPSEQAGVTNIQIAIPDLALLSPLPSGHPKTFQRLPVRSSIWCYPNFNLPKGRSLGFASTPTD